MSHCSDATCRVAASTCCCAAFSVSSCCAWAGVSGVSAAPEGGVPDWASAWAAVSTQRVPPGTCWNQVSWSRVASCAPPSGSSSRGSRSVSSAVSASATWVPEPPDPGPAAVAAVTASASTAVCPRDRPGSVAGTFGLTVGTPSWGGPSAPCQFTWQTRPWQIVFEGRNVCGAAGSVVYPWAAAQASAALMAPGSSFPSDQPSLPVNAAQSPAVCQPASGSVACPAYQPQTV